jgi:hypothetical protein
LAASPGAQPLLQLPGSPLPAHVLRRYHSRLPAQVRRYRPGCTTGIFVARAGSGPHPEIGRAVAVCRRPA